MSLERLETGDMVCEYNGYLFGPTADTIAFSVTPNMDPARRTVMSATYRITVSEYLEDTKTTDPAVLDAIQRLSKSGGQLTYVGRGFGDLNINFVARNVGRDVAWGPITRSVGARPVGAGLATLLTWEVEFTTVNCDDALTVAGTILCFTYTVNYSVDKEGYTTRKYNASLTIAQTKKQVSDQTLSATADDQYEKMTPPPLANFRRTEKNRTLSADKCTLTVDVTDVQMPPQVPPVGVVDGSVEHTYQSQQWTRWTGTLSATFDVAQNRDPNAVVKSFDALLKQRLAFAGQMIQGVGLDFTGGIPRRLNINPGQKVSIVPIGATVTEPNVIGRTQVRISLSYLVVGCGLSEILRSGGLWTNVAPALGYNANQWQTWVQSLPSTQAPRGHAKIVFTPNDDLIVDACGSGHQRIVTPGSPPPPPPVSPGSGNFLTALLTTAGGFFGNYTPTPVTSWIYYRNAVSITPDTGRVAGNTLPDAPLTTGAASRSGTAWDASQDVPRSAPPNQSPFPPLGGLLGSSSTSPGSSNGTQAAQTFYQQRNKPSLYVTISGQAIRAGWQIPVPELVLVNGARPVLVGNPYFATAIVANAGVPIVRADWRLTYLFVDDQGSPTGSIGAAPNELFS